MKTHDPRPRSMAIELKYNTEFLLFLWMYYRYYLYAMRYG